MKSKYFSKKISSRWLKRSSFRLHLVINLLLIFSCDVISDNHGIDGGFISAACWIQGVYIYTVLWNRTDESAFFGITKDINMDGMLANKELCNTEPILGKELKKGCTPMEKTFFLQVRIDWRKIFKSVETFLRQTLSLFFSLSLFSPLFGWEFFTALSL